ncbi:MAG TPA: helix-turn-helix domain-containing protein [Marmoricola sp.]
MAVGKSRRRLDAGTRREEILDTAERLVAEHGYRGLRLDQVAETCAMTRAGILHHFSSKEAVLVALLERRDALDEAELRRRFAGPLDRAATRAALHDLVVRNSAQPDLIRLYTVLSAESLDPAHPAHDYFVQRQRRAVQLLAEVAAPWHPAPDRLATSVLAFLDGIQIQWLRDPGVDLVAAWDAVAEVVLDVHVA